MGKKKPNLQPDPFAGFDGYEVPRYTQVPDQLFDEHLPHLGHAELKVLLYIIRRTFGWGKEADAISLSQLERGTGLTRRSVREAVKGLEQKNLILADRYSTPRGDPGVNVYRLNIKRRNRPASARQDPPPNPQKPPGDQVSQGRGDTTLPQDTHSTAVGEKLNDPYETLETPEHDQKTLSEQTLSQQQKLSLDWSDTLTNRFFTALGYTKVPRQKRERASSIISQLLAEGFTPREITAAIELAAARNARDAAILPYVIGEAVATLPPQDPSPEPSNPLVSAESTYEQLLTQIRTLPDAAQERLRQAALKRLGNRPANEAVLQGIMIGLYQRGLHEASS